MFRRANYSRGTALTDGEKGAESPLRNSLEVRLARIELNAAPLAGGPSLAGAIAAAGSLRRFAFECDRDSSVGLFFSQTEVILRRIESNVAVHEEDLLSLLQAARYVFGHEEQR